MKGLRILGLIMGFVFAFTISQVKAVDVFGVDVGNAITTIQADVIHRAVHTGGRVLLANAGQIATILSSIADKVDKQTLGLVLDQISRQVQEREIYTSIVRNLIELNPEALKAFIIPTTQEVASTVVRKAAPSVAGGFVRGAAQFVSQKSPATAELVSGARELGGRALSSLQYNVWKPLAGAFRSGASKLPAAPGLPDMTTLRNMSFSQLKNLLQTKTTELYQLSKDNPKAAVAAAAAAVAVATIGGVLAWKYKQSRRIRTERISSADIPRPLAIPSTENDFTQDDLAILNEVGITPAEMQSFAQLIINTPIPSNYLVSPDNTQELTQNSFRLKVRYDVSRESEGAIKISITRITINSSKIPMKMYELTGDNNFNQGQSTKMSKFLIERIKKALTEAKQSSTLGISKPFFQITAKEREALSLEQTSLLTSVGISSSLLFDTALQIVNNFIAEKEAIQESLARQKRGWFFGPRAQFLEQTQKLKGENESGYLSAVVSATINYGGYSNENKITISTIEMEYGTNGLIISRERKTFPINEKSYIEIARFLAAQIQKYLGSQIMQEEYQGAELSGFSG